MPAHISEKRVYSIVLIVVMDKDSGRCIFTIFNLITNYLPLAYCTILFLVLAHILMVALQYGYNNRLLSFFAKLSIFNYLWNKITIFFFSLTAIGLTPSTHLHTNSTQNNTTKQNIQKIHNNKYT